MDESIDLYPAATAAAEERRMDRRVFGVLFFSLFSTITGVGIVVPLLPVYAHHLGASGIYIGLIFGAFSLSRTFFLPYFGRRSDKKGRKPFILGGLVSYSIISFVYIFSDSVEMLIAVRFIQGIASAMIMPVVQAYVGDLTPDGKEGSVMGLFHMSMFLGLSIGPVIGGVINDRFGLDPAFVCMGILSFIGLLLSLLFLPPVEDERVLQVKSRPEGFFRLVLKNELAGIFFFRFAYTACIGVIWAFLPVFADTYFSISSSKTGVLVMMGVFISGLLHMPMGFIADRLNRHILVLIGGVIVSVSIAMYETAGGFSGLILASTLFGVGGGIAMPALMALAVRIGGLAESMGTVMSILTMAHSLGMMVGAFSAGIMMDMLDLKQAFSGGVFIMAAGTLLFAVLNFRAFFQKSRES